MTTETPARKRSIVIFPVIPRPPAAFSPFTMTKSKPYFDFSSASRAITAVRPGSPTMSPRKRTVSPRFDRDKRESSACLDEPWLAEIFYAAICGERHHAQIRPSALAASEVITASEAEQTSSRCEDRARSGPSRWQMGKDGGALVSGG